MVFIVFLRDANSAICPFSIIQSLKQQLEQLERPVNEDRSDNALGSAPRDGQSSEGPGVLMSELQQRRNDSQGIQDVRQLLDSWSANTPPAPQYSPAAANSTLIPDNSQSDRVECSVKSARLVPEGACTQVMSPAASDTSRQLEMMMEPIMTRFGHDEVLQPQSQGKQLDGCRCDVALDPGVGCCLPLRRSADSMVNLFFSRHNIVFPVLHERSFRKHYESVWSSEQTACCGLCRQPNRGKLFLPTIHAVFATVSLLGDGHPENNAAKAESFMVMAQNFDLFTVLEAGVGLELVQLLLLICRYLASTEKIAKYKSMSGIVIRLAQQIGLHLDMNSAKAARLLSSAVTQLDSELRARVWCACVSLERSVFDSS